MAQFTVEQALGNAVRHHQAGQLLQAESLYRQILAEQSDHPDATHLLGVLAHQQGKHDVAIELIRRAIGYRIYWPDAYFNLGNALKEKGDLDEAILAFQQAVALAPNHIAALNNLGNALRKRGRLDDALTAFDQANSIKPSDPQTQINLGNVLREQGKLDEAISAFRRSIFISPGYAPSHANLGGTLRESGKLDDAIAAFKTAISLSPDLAEAQRNLGNTLRDKGYLDEAVTALRRAITLRPGLAEGHSDLAVALSDQGQFKESIACCRKAISLDPTLAAAHNILGNALREENRHDDAIAAFRCAIAVKPDDAQGYSNLGNVLKEAGQLPEALAAYRQAVSIDPNDAVAGSNLLLALHYDPCCDAKALAAEHRNWNRQHAERLSKFFQPHINNRATDRQLKIGYISPDFSKHVVGRSLLHLLKEHDRQQFQVVLYSKVIRPDLMTDHFKQVADTWRNIVGSNDEQVADLIRGDQIDILVDLSLHTAGNSLLVFARRPAPVQVSYLGYCGTTGMPAMDYRLSDRFLDPPGTDLSLYSEKTVFLDSGFWCYKPNESAPGISPLPAATSNHITFGCLNNFSKVSTDALNAWARILGSVPNSKLILHARPGNHRQIAIDRLVGNGAEASQIEFVGVQSFADYLRTYNRIDIALDPFPFAGGITSCDSLWMGVPIITLVGIQSPVSRGGCTLLQNIGLSEFIAPDRDQYIAIAIQAANDLPRLLQLRKTLRTQIKQSPLMNIPKFVRDLETAYRQMWHNWCRSDSVSPS